MRGLVVSPPMLIGADGNVQLRSAQLDPQSLRTNLLFWDKLALPRNKHLEFGLGPDVSFLVNLGLVELTPVDVPGGEGGAILWAAHLKGFSHHDKLEPGCWSLSTGDGSINFPAKETINNRGILVRLHNAIPVPDKDVPLSDIVNFRERRRDELLSLRTYLEDLYQSILASGDPALAQNTALNRLEKAISDHLAVSKEFGFKLRISSLEANLDYGTLLVAGVALWHGDLNLVGAAFAAKSAISISQSVGLNGREKTSTPFRYVSRIHNELLV